MIPPSAALFERGLVYSPDQAEIGTFKGSCVQEPGWWLHIVRDFSVFDTPKLGLASNQRRSSWETVGGMRGPLKAAVSDLIVLTLAGMSLKSVRHVPTVHPEMGCARDEIEHCGGEGRDSFEFTCTPFSIGSR